jgi:hypothetical protein
MRPMEAERHNETDPMVARVCAPDHEVIEHEEEAELP